MRLSTYRLEKSGHLFGISCGEEGPALGPIRLLEKSGPGFAPRPLDELNAMLGWTIGHPVDCTNLVRGIQSIAAALNRGELARAMIATQFLPLSPLDAQQAQRAATAVALFKAAVDDPKHPGWPAGTPDRRGGKFRPKDASLADLDELQINLPDARRTLATRIEQKIARAAIRAVLRRVLTYKRIVRLLGEAASNAVPGLDVIGDAAMALDVAEIAGEMVRLRQQAIIARAWVQHGPFTLSELRAIDEDLSFDTFDAFKKMHLEKYARSAGDEFEYHHIIPQASNLSGRVLNSTRNIIRLPSLIHQMVSDEWAALARQRGLTLGEYLNGMSYSEQRRIGLKILRDLGILK